MNEFPDKSAFDCDDQLPIYARIGRGPKGNSVILRLTDNQKDETYITCYEVDADTGEEKELWKTSNLNAGSITLDEKYIHEDTASYFQLLFKKRRPNTSDNWNYETPLIPIKQSSKHEWPVTLSGDFTIPHTREGYNTTVITAEILETTTDTPTYEWSVASGNGIEVASGQGTRQCTFKAKSGGMHTINTIRCLVGETENYKATIKYGTIVVGADSSVVIFDETKFEDASWYNGTSFIQFNSGSEIPKDTLLRFKIKSSLINNNNNYKIGYNSSNYQYVNPVNPYIKFNMPNESIQVDYVAEPKPQRSVNFKIKNDSGQWVDEELKMFQNKTKQIKAIISDTATTSGTWTTSNSSIITITNTSGTLEQTITSKTNDGNAKVKLKLNAVDATFDASGQLTNPGFCESTHEKLCIVGVNKAYANYVSSSHTLTFYYDNQYSTRSGRIDYVPTSTTVTTAPWSGIASSVQYVTFDSTFADYQPVNMTHWFDNMQYVSSLNLSNLNTSACVKMDYLFNKCSNLTRITFGSNFNTENVVDMNHMFNGCASLTSLTLPDAMHVLNVTNMSYMFSNTSKLSSLAFPKDSTYKDTFLTSSLIDCNHMFYSCGLSKIRMPDDFDTTHVGNPSGSTKYMFYGCKNLTIVYMPQNFILNTSGNICYYGYMFASCPKLQYVLIYGDATTSWVKSSSSSEDSNPWASSPKAGAIHDGSTFILLNNQTGSSVSEKRECMRTFDRLISGHEYGGLTPISRYSVVKDEYAKEHNAPEIKFGNHYVFRHKKSGLYLGADFDNPSIEGWRQPKLLTKCSDSHILIDKPDNTNCKILTFYDHSSQGGCLNVASGRASINQPLRTYFQYSYDISNWFILVEDTVYSGWYHIVPYHDIDLSVMPDADPGGVGTWVRLYLTEEGNERQLWKPESI